LNTASADATEPSIDAVEAELRTQRWHLRFAEAVEARFEADQHGARARAFIQAGLPALLIYNLFLVNDWLLRPEVFGKALFWRLGVLTAYGVGVLFLIHRGLSSAWRETAMASTLVVAMVSSSMIIHHTRSSFAAYDLFALSLAFTAGNILFSLRFVQALASTLLGFGVAAALALRHPVIPFDALASALGLMACTAAFSLMACRRIEIESRRSYLLLLREALRTRVTQRSAEALAQLSLTDPLTGLANRRAFENRLADFWQHPERRSEPRALLAIDIDHFKRYNDCFGHPAGDTCLRQVASALRDHVREHDLVARTGGEEFVVLMARASSTEVQAAAERLRRAIEDLALPHDGLDGRHRVTISIGLALAPDADHAPAHALLEAADRALYRAKGEGRNRCATAADGL
jgi:diguanylate cyclase (GGDEF)-like protein